MDPVASAVWPTTTPFSGQHPMPTSKDLKPRPSPTASMDSSDPAHRTASPEKSGRSSFSSVREDDTEIAQSFTSTKVSSYARRSEEAVDDQPSPLDMAQTQFMPPLTQPSSRLHGCWFPAVAADSFQGWKQINVKGKLASRSFGDLQALRICWTTPSTPKKSKDPELPAAGQSRLERLPTELLNQIIDHFVLDVPPNGVTARNVDLMSMLLTSKTLHQATLDALYRNITIPHSRIFRKFLDHVSQNEKLGTIVRRLDFSHYNPTGLFSTQSERATTRNLTPETLLRCLNLTPYLREFLGQEYVDDEISADVLRKLFFDLPRLEGLDFCGCSSAAFKASFESILSWDWPDKLSITRLSLHRCISLPSAVFEKILPRLGNLTHLDLAGTRVTNAALQSLPHTARLTHLNLAKCKLLRADAVTDFLANHPAVAGNSLVYLSLAADARSHQLLDVDDVTAILPILRRFTKLRALSLKGSKMHAGHIPALRQMLTHLEELALGRRLTVPDIDGLFRPEKREADGEEEAVVAVPFRHTLKYLDLSDYLISELEVTALFARDGALLRRASRPLEVVEVDDATVHPRLARSSAVRNLGWSATDFGSRAWLVRRHHHHHEGDDADADADAEDAGPRDSGLRAWKMGASFWGMRKVPVAVADVGGMYGSYMFKRKL
ncbi:hypothetical protein F4780DRAFT_774748 [Xylariomycetidae sp. FL0641]|nr:hypothetical protein F4780DRAFT_774748 [Xylariomycetidae sp. FL0641]